MMNRFNVTWEAGPEIFILHWHPAAPAANQWALNLKAPLASGSPGNKNIPATQISFRNREAGLWSSKPPGLKGPAGSLFCSGKIYFDIAVVVSHIKFFYFTVFCSGQITFSLFDFTCYSKFFVGSGNAAGYVAILAFNSY